MLQLPEDLHRGPSFLPLFLPLIIILLHLRFFFPQSSSESQVSPTVTELLEYTRS